MVDSWNALEEYALETKPRSTPVDDHHLFLLLEQSVSRIPSMSSLVDHVQLVGHRQGIPLSANPEGGATDRACTTQGPVLDRHCRAEAERRGNGVLAGGGRSIHIFRPWGGEQFIQSQKLRHLQQCAAVMLWGCSPGAMRDMGDFDAVGTPYHYMLAGCPTLVAMLWDVTDRECDRFAQSVFTSLKLDEPRPQISDG
ncbi:hypothetical protein FS749_005285 [Ceratobasidium sp. UAMH 11750]|nr:hypothetical protein FS749_005285 [Ceratobasidium sp. UAMH 11750]